MSGSSSYGRPSNAQRSIPDPQTPPTPNPVAADVNFAKLNTEHHAEVRSSSSKRSSTSDRQKVVEGRTSFQSDRHSNGSPLGRPKKLGGFLLDSIMANGSSRGQGLPRHHGKATSPNGHRQLDKRKSTYSHLSAQSSRRSTAVSRDSGEVSYDGSFDTTTKGDTVENTRSSSMDPAQLVQMALNLGESRKRHTSNILPVPASPAGGRRVASALDSGYGTVKSGPSSDNNASYLVGGLHRPASGSRNSQQEDTAPAENSLNGNNVPYEFSPATLSRAEKARRYFELASEHRRLLEHLPPLKTDSTAPGNYTLQATSSPGSAHYNLNRIRSNTNNKRQLGRGYNPLQSLRNRRLRNRERRVLTAPPETWQETDRIKQWINGVEAASKDPSYRPGDDQVRLPAFSGELEAEVFQPETAKRHQRSDTATSVITRPENGWTIEPAELLADTYWVEKENNKFIIEDKQGRRVFPLRASASIDVPRPSGEFEPGNEHSADKYSQVHESEDEDRVRTRRRNLLPIPGRLRRGHVTRSVSSSSLSSDDGRKPPQFLFGNMDGGDENIGPLERHMRGMIAKDEMGQLSPELVSPDRDHWDHKHVPVPESRKRTETKQRGSTSTSNSHISAGAQGYKRSKSADGRMRSLDHGIGSMNERVSGSPTSPVFRDTAPFLGIDSSSPKSKPASPIDGKQKHHHLSIFRSRSKERNNIAQTDFANANGRPLTPIMSAESTLPWSRSSLDSARPDEFQRQRTNHSAAGSLRRGYTANTGTDASIKDNGSAVGRRFFKGGRIGELVRGEGSRFGDRFRSGRDRAGGDAEFSPNSSTGQLDVVERDDGLYKRGRAYAGDKDETESQVSPRASFERDQSRPRYHNPNLPSFVSYAGRNRASTVGTPMSETSDPFARHDKAPNNQYSRHPPPKINLPENDALSDSDLGGNGLLRASTAFDHRRSASQNDLSLIATIATAAGPRRKDGFPVTGLAGHDAKRHWSISDQAASRQMEKVTAGDIARVRTLLLASGVKARQIYTQAETPRESPLPLIAKAAETAGESLPSVTRRKEHLVASRLLSAALERDLREFEASLQAFQTGPAKDLSSRLDELVHRASEQLTKIVNETSDEADAFNVELTTRQPLEVKRVDEGVDAMFRQRRRRFRLVRHAQSKTLEWLLLGIMWWVWFVVVLINTARKIFVGLWRFLSWLLWF